MLTPPVPDDSLLTELRTAIASHREAEQLVAVLRHALTTRDIPRPWSFTHAGVSGWVRDQPGRDVAAGVVLPRSEVEAKLREAVCALPFDTGHGPIDVRATAHCKDTGESVDLWVHISQPEPPCFRAEGHEWALLLEDRTASEGRVLLEGCPHCDGQKKTSSPVVGEPPVVRYNAPHHYPEGSVRRRLRENAG